MRLRVPCRQPGRGFHRASRTSRPPDRLLSNVKIDLRTVEPEGAERNALLPWLIVLFAGTAALGLWFLIRPALGPGAYYRSVVWRYTYGFNKQVLLLFVPYGLALLAYRRGSRAPLWALLGGAAFLHVLVLLAPLPQSQDFYQYLFYGKMQAAHGANPYVVHPSVFYRDPWYSFIRWPNATSVYGPAWTLISYGVVKLTGGSLTAAFVTLKSVILAMDLGIMAMILKLSAYRRDAEEAAGWGLLVYAWNPLIWITVPLGGLADAAIAAAFMGAILARRRGRPWMATVLLALASLVKVYAVVGLILHLVLLARRSDRKTAGRHGAVAVSLAAVAYWPYWVGLSTFRGVADIADKSNWSLTGTLQDLLVPLLRGLGFRAAQADAANLVRWAGALILIGAVTWAARRATNERRLWQGTAAVLAAYLYLTPWFLPWYAVAPLAIVAVLPFDRLTAPLLTFSATSLITTPWSWPVGQVAQTITRYTPPLFLLARRARPSLPAMRHAPTRPGRGGSALPPRATEYLGGRVSAAR